MEKQNEPCCEECGTNEDLLKFSDPYGYFEYVRCEACNEQVAVRAMEGEYEA